MSYLLALDKKFCLLLALALGCTHSFLKIVYSFRTQRKLLAGLDNFPGKRGHWLFGLAKEMRKNRNRQYDWRVEIMGDHKTFYMHMPLLSNALLISTRDPIVVKHMLKDHFDVWNKPSYGRVLFASIFQQVVKFSHHGKYAPDKGKSWQHTRKTASNIFTRDNLNDFFSNTFRDEGKIFLQVLDKVEKGKAIDMQKMFFGFTMDSVMRVFFGRETSTLLGEDDSFAHAFDESQRRCLSFYFKSLAIVGLFDLLPWPLGPLRLGYVNGNISKLYRSLHPDGKAFNNAVALLHRRVIEIIKDKIKDPNLKSKNDLLASFMNCVDDNGETYAQAKYIDYLRGLSLNLLVAGRDTTACTLSWLFYILSTNPNVQKKLCEEIDNVLQGKLPTQEEITASKMPYLNGVIYETLRIYPPVPMDPKESIVDDVLPDGTKIAKGTTMAFFPYAMGRDAERYPDPLVVKPERWIPFVQPSDYEFPVFQAGPRICLGKNMAILEAKILTCMVLQKYTFTLLEGEAEKIRPSVMIAMSICNSTPEKESYSLMLIPHSRDQSN